MSSSPVSGPPSWTLFYAPWLLRPAPVLSSIDRTGARRRGSFRVASDTHFLSNASTVGLGGSKVQSACQPGRVETAAVFNRSPSRRQGSHAAISTVGDQKRGPRFFRNSNGNDNSILWRSLEKKSRRALPRSYFETLWAHTTSEPFISATLGSSLRTHAFPNRRFERFVNGPISPIGQNRSG